MLNARQNKTTSEAQKNQKKVRKSEIQFRCIPGKKLPVEREKRDRQWETFGFFQVSVKGFFWSFLFIYVPNTEVVHLINNCRSFTRPMNTE